ncbi:hypothetical protein BaRGS_00040355 [Batillaria attramentaria]|uniref:Uncharacterized protein n=1 Tax=Batillaria attramentaria TaxID=370345 RepID=A0ABD0J0G4_9CAEN
MSLTEMRQTGMRQTNWDTSNLDASDCDRLGVMAMSALLSCKLTKRMAVCHFVPVLNGSPKTNTGTAWLPPDWE